MPEGDTIHRLAEAIRPDLLGRVLRSVVLRDRGELQAFAGARVERVEAVGKHLLISVASGWTLHTHLGLHGDVHRYAVDEPWKRDRCNAVLVIDTDAAVFAWFEPARAELWPTKALRAHPALSRLGPDLLSPRVDLDEVARRAAICARLRGPTYTVAELLLDQSIACGVGNIYKNEVLFLEGVSPLTPADSVDEADLRRLYARARRLLGSNVGKGRRSTRRGTDREGAPLGRGLRLWVYGREGLPCLCCGAIVRMVGQGVRKRVTFYCERCQPFEPRDQSRPYADVGVPKRTQ